MDKDFEVFSTHLDVTGLRCPLPLLKAKKALNELDDGAVLKVSATDPGSKRDFQAYIEHSSHQMLNSCEEAGVYFFLIKKGA